MLVCVCVCAERKFLFGVSKRMSLWSGIAFFLNILINFIVAGFYPYNNYTMLGKVWHAVDTYIEWGACMKVSVGKG